MPPKISFILENFYPTHRAGTESYVLNLAKGLKEKGWQVSVIIAAVGEGSSDYVYEGIDVYALSVPQKVSVFELNGLSEPSNLSAFKELLTRLKPELVHFHSFSRSFTHFHLKAAHDFGIKVVFTAHLGGIFCARGDMQLFGREQCNARISNFRCTACYASKQYGRTKSWLGAVAASIKPVRHKYPAFNLISNKQQSMHYLAKYAHSCVAIARWIENAFVINNIKQTTLITQAIDTSKFIPKKSTILSQKIQLGFIGRMNPSKGLHILLEALTNLNNQFDLHCVTIKDETEEPYYRQMKAEFAKLGYSDWQENLTHEQLNAAMEKWDILAFPSFYEVAPLVILEAFAKRIPAVGSDYPAIAEMITEGKNGWIFRNGDSKHLAVLLEKLYSVREQIPQIIANIEQPKDISELIEEHINLYNSIVSE